jgi:hypothetical protein
LAVDAESGSQVQGRTLLGYKDVVVDGSGSVSINETLAAFDLSVGDWITTTATALDAGTPRGTSAFSVGVEVPPTATIESATMVGSDLVVTGTLTGKSGTTYAVDYYGNPAGVGAPVLLATQNVTVGASGTEALLLQLASFDYAAYMSIYATPTPTAGRVGPRATPVAYQLPPVT